MTLAPWRQVEALFHAARARYQFLIEINPPSCRVMDMASTNGTRVNGRRVTAADLKDGDLIGGGRTTFAVAIKDAPPSRPGASRIHRSGTGVRGLRSARNGSPPYPAI